MCMYNKEIKERYVKEKTATTILPDSYLERLFKKTEVFEKEHGKDVSNFTFYEIEEMYKTWSIGSLQSLQVINSALSMYTQWCLQKNMVIDSQNHYLETTKDILAGTINHLKAKSRIITREQLLNLLPELPNASDAFLLLALFEGIWGKEYCELSNLSLKDIKGNVATLCTGREVLMSDVLTRLAIESGNTYEYYPVTAVSKKEKMFFDECDDKIIKDFYNTVSDTCDFQIGRRIYRKIKRSVDYVGMAHLNGNNLVECGKVDFINKICEEKKITAKEYLYSKNGSEELKQQYGSCFTSPTRTAFMKKYEEYLI